VTGWTVELTKAAQRQFRNLESGPRQAAAELIADLAEDPSIVPSIELRGKPHIRRARFHHDRYRMIYLIARAGKRIIVKRIRPRPTAYEGI